MYTVKKGDNLYNIAKNNNTTVSAIVDLNNLVFDYNESFKTLTEEEKNKVNSYKMEDDRIRSIISFMLLKRYTPDTEVTHNEYGKPYKEGLYFNISHSKNLVVMLTSTFQEVGVDTEWLFKPIKDNLDLYVFGKKIEPNSLFIEMWTRKEAVGKCIGTGVMKGMREIPYKEGLNKYNGIDIFVRTIIYKEYAISLALKGKLAEPYEIIEVKEL